MINVSLPIQIFILYEKTQVLNYFNLFNWYAIDFDI